MSYFSLVLMLANIYIYLKKQNIHFKGKEVVSSVKYMFTLVTVGSRGA